MYRFQAMNTSIETYYLNERQNRQTEAWFQHAEKTLSRFLPSSELSQMNRTKDVPFSPGDVLFDSTYAADRFYKETEGLFNPYLGNDLCSIGYDRSFEKIRSGEVAADERPIEPVSENLRPPEIDPNMRTITMHGAALDLGGFGKGWTAQQAADQLQKVRPYGGIAAGGDIIVWGRPPEKWTIAISDPEVWSQKLFSFRLDRPAAIATSSTVRRRWKDRSGIMHHHILDPRTRQSTNSDLIQVSVIASDLPTAEVYAKCMMILGWAKGSSWIAGKYPLVGMIGMKKDRSIVTGGATRNYSSGGLMNDGRTADQHA